MAENVGVWVGGGVAISVATLFIFRVIFRVPYVNKIDCFQVSPRSTRYNARFLEHGAVKRNGLLSFLAIVRKLSSFFNTVTNQGIAARKQKRTL